jgi:hypothetical protein
MPRNSKKPNPITITSLFSRVIGASLLVCSALKQCGSLKFLREAAQRAFVRHAVFTSQFESQFESQF